MRIELERVILGSDSATTRVRNGTYTEAEASLWYENGFVWVKPKLGKLRFYHPANCEMYPKPGQAGVPAVPGEEPKAKAKAA